MIVNPLSIVTVPLVLVSVNPVTIRLFVWLGVTLPVWRDVAPAEWALLVVSNTDPDADPLHAVTSAIEKLLVPVVEKV